MDIYLVTRNSGKLAAAQSIFNPQGIRLCPTEKEYPEIQADTSLEIARQTAVLVAKELGQPAIREDHSLFINALHFPGPYTNYFEKNISSALLLQMMTGFQDRSGYFEIATVYAEPDGKTIEFVYRVPIILAQEERGEGQQGWSRLLMLEGEKQTFAEYPEKERLHVWAKNYQAVAQELSSRL